MDWLPSVRGKESTTLFFVTVSWSLVAVKFLVAGVDLGLFGLMPPMTALEFGGAVAFILAIWLGREWQEKSL